MCTLTFIPRNNGYYLAMNRDERIARGPADPPAKFLAGGVDIICPRDTEGGTWIAANSRGAAFALLNWNDVMLNALKTRSRGDVIPALFGSSSSREAEAMFSQVELKGILPFRLVGIFPIEKQVSEWRWDQKSLDCHPLSWNRGHWFSSSLSDEKALQHRGAACYRAWQQDAAGSIMWL